MNENVVSAQIKRAYPKYSEVTKGLLRVERDIGETKYSVMFFDYSADVLNEEFDLDAYQNKFISTEYYKTEGALQWNHYLIFVVPEGTAKKNKNVSRLKTEIEGNRQFTRKYFIEDNELSAFLEPKSLVDMVSAVAPEASPYNRWIQQLNAVDLDGLHLGDDYTAIIEGLKSNRVIKERPNSGSVVSTEQLDSRLNPLHPIEFLKIEDFKRSRPPASTYPLGQFTLLFGPNGIGKTSFLEAVEMSYCGMSARNSKFRDSSLKFGIKYKEVEEIDYYDPENLQKYRERDLHWYENRYEGKNRLFESFSKYNFFDTDSAARLSANTDAQKALVDAFISLSLGDKVNHLEDRIVKLHKSLKSELNRCDSSIEEQKKRHDESASLVSSLQSKASGLGQEFSVLEQVFQKAPATFSIPPMSDLVDSDFSNKIESILNSSAKIRNSLYWLAVVTPELIVAQKVEVANDLRVFTLYVGRQASNAKNVVRLKSQALYFSKLKEVIDRTRVYQKLVDVRLIPDLGKKVTALSQRKANYTRAIDFLDQFKIELNVKSKTVTDALAEIQVLKETTNTQLQAISKKIQEHKSAQEKIDGLIQEIRAKSKDLVRANPKLEECPVCQTHHASGTLEKILKQLSTKSSGENDLATTIQDQSNFQNTLIKADQAEIQLKKLNSLFTFLRQEGAVTDSLERVPALRISCEKSLKSLSDELENLQAIEAILNSNGLSESEFSELTSEIAKGAAHLNLSSDSIDSVDIFQEKIREEDLKLENERLGLEDSDAIKSDLTKIRARIGQAKSDDEVLSELKRRQSEMTNVLKELEQLRSLAKLSDQQEVRGIEQSFQAVHQQYIQFRATERTEREKGSVLPSKLREVDELKKSLEALGEVKLRMTRALDTLNSIIQSDSKAQNLERFLGTYKHFILKIFTRIHRPVEFSDINIKDQEILLTRVQDDKAVPLTMISTGQRAALALSIFLSLNLSLRKGPPVILIDDPVAHVDDLNTLAFLDYLREIVASGQRQVIFATADSKMAQLIRRKFEFLGQKFITYPIAGRWRLE